MPEPPPLVTVTVTEATGKAQAAALELLAEVGFPRAVADGVTNAELLLQARAINGMIIGAIHGRTRLRGSESTVWHLGVLPEFRRQGVGRALLDAYCDHERAAGADGVHVRVAPDVAPDVWAFYRACGWRWDGAGYDRFLRSDPPSGRGG